MFCHACNSARDLIKSLMNTPWESLIANYEFMIVFASFHRNVTFYSNMHPGQLKHLYSQLVSFSPARILVLHTLMSAYRKRELACFDTRTGELDVPRELSKAITLAVGNQVPEQFIHKCITMCKWKGYEEMILGAFASAESIRSGALKYMSVVKESMRDRGSVHTIISLAVTGWLAKLSGFECGCGTWAQAINLISCFVPDTETTLTIQDLSRISAYICTLLDLEVIPQKTEFQDSSSNLDFGYIFRDLLVSGLHTDHSIATHH